MLVLENYVGSSAPPGPPSVTAQYIMTVRIEIIIHCKNTIIL